ncbi:hypothetical protein BYT27DRAFT_7047757, partial [Phlegmacium glaucopus]
QIKVRWTQGHVGLKGNKEVDKEAKMATEGEERNQNSDFGILKSTLPTSKSAHRQWLRAKEKKRWIKSFQEGPRRNRVAAIDTSMPSNKYRKMT